METIANYVRELVTLCGIPANAAPYAIHAAMVIVAILLSAAAGLLCRKLIVPLVQKVPARTDAKWDDIVFSIAGREARAFASQGQQRSIVLALKLAEVVLARELVDDQPLLLLDDVMSELDAQRRAAVVSFIEEGIQTIITTTNLGYFSQDMVDAAKVVEF